MAKPGKAIVVPRARFPNFVGGPLREIRLGDVTAESAIRNGDEFPATSVMGVSKLDGIVPMEERIIASDIARYKVVQNNWFAYNPMRINIGSIARWRGEADILVSPDYVVFRCLDDQPSGIEPDYLDHFRQSTFWNAFVSEGGNGGVRIRIYYEDLASLGMALPSRAEQRKIADCLNSLDEVIAAQGRKLEVLKTYKRCMMQQLFPEDGKTKPRIRFSEFRKSGPWHLRNLSDLLQERKQRNRGLKFGATEVLSVSGDYGCVNQIEHLGRSYAGVSVKEYHIVETGDLVYTKSPLKKSPYGIIRENKGKPGIVSTLYAVYSPTDLGHPAYLDHYFSRNYTLNSYLQPLVRKGPKNDMKVNNAAVLSGELLAPKIPEQRKIADYLNSLDKVIAAQRRRFEASKVYKRSLMQQLFPILKKV